VDIVSRHHPSPNQQRQIFSIHDVLPDRDEYFPGHLKQALVPPVRVHLSEVQGDVVMGAEEDGMKGG